MTLKNKLSQWVSQLRILFKLGIKEWWLSRLMSYEEKSLYLKVYGWTPSNFFVKKAQALEMEQEGRLTIGRRPFPKDKRQYLQPIGTPYVIEDIQTFMRVTTEPDNDGACGHDN